jgi:hypothetical protein
MALIQTRLSGPSSIATVGTYGGSQYTVPNTATSTIVKQIILSNITAAVHTVTVTLKPSGITIADTHILLKDLTLTEKETTFINLALVMETGDEIYVLSSSSSVNATISGVEVT